MAKSIFGLSLGIKKKAYCIVLTSGEAVFRLDPFKKEEKKIHLLGKDFWRKLFLSLDIFIMLPGIPFTVPLYIKCL